MKKLSVIVGIVFVVTLGIFIFNKKTGAPLPDTANEYKNATYVLDGKLTMISDTNTGAQYFGNVATGDLNGDGMADVAFVVTQNPGGSGTFYYVVAALKTSNGYAGTNGVLLGDRISPQTTGIENGILTVNYTERKASDPMTTAPSVGVSKYLKIIDGKLVEVRNPTSFPVTYVNTDYGFTFSLPSTWKEYSIVKNTWTGTPLGKTAVETGTKLLIRNPKWSLALPYEDIPVLVFTTAQWDAYVAEDFTVSAAPVPATEIGRNNAYVFALPPRWDFDYKEDVADAQMIVQAKTLIPFTTQ